MARMRSCLLYVYWALLLISTVSSGLLFLIVASEGVQTEDSSFRPEKNETYGTYNNILYNYNNHEENSDSSNILNIETQDTDARKTSQNDHLHQEEAAAVSASFDTITSENMQAEKNVDVLAEGLTQQPNLSQGISETGQAVVLTLVDTAAAELQSLAEPKITHELSSRSSIKNSSLLDSGVGQSEHLKEALPTTAPSIVDETSEQSNETVDLAEQQEEALLLKKISEETPEVVVIVRAEQKVNTDELELRVEDEIGQIVPEELPKVDDMFTTAPELNDTAARAQLVGGNRDETSAVILDGLVTSGPTDPHEDIPSFSEWAQKRLEEAEKKKTHPNVSVQTPGGPGRGVSGMKVRSKNYASPDCGAKVVAANPEARSARNVLVSTRDEYMLNTCTSRVWFVVELCEAIQAKKIELANFELFSSSPKDFSVYVSDRFPTRDWSPVGQFTAKDVKDVQSFALHPHFFGKFIKVELQSHYGSEHFCPVSLFRAYGTSEFEVLETETENQVLQETNANEHDEEEDSDEEEPLDSRSDDDPPRNLFGSARDAVLNIVKKAAELLVKSSGLTGNNITEIQQSIDGGNILDKSYTTCTTPRYTILCAKCTDQKFASVFQLVSCLDRQLDSLLRIDLVNRTLRRGRLCGLHGVEIESSWRGKEEKNEFPDTKRDDTMRFNLAQDLQSTFLASLFKPEYIIALCNVLATKERKVVMNTSYEISVNASEDATKEDILSNKNIDQNSEIASHHQDSATCTPDSNSPVCKLMSSKDVQQRVQDANQKIENVNTTSIGTFTSTDLASQIKPTKTFSKEDLRKEPSVPILEPSKEPAEETLQAEVLTTISPPLNLPTATLKIAEDPTPVAGTSVEITSQTATNILQMNLDNQEVGDIFVPETETVEIGTQVKPEKSESSEQDGKQKETKESEQDVRFSSQDHLALDTLLSDLKDFDGDTVNMQHGGSGLSLTTQPTASSVPQKESVFLRLSNRIKVLERNMSLSGQYLEELSRRYKKQVEEMQRSLERAMSTMNEESRKGEEREAKLAEEISILKKEVVVLSKSVETLLHERDSWRGRISTIGQQALLICLQILIVILILSYRRKTGDDEEEENQLTIKKKNVCRKSAENFSSRNGAKKAKKRRPSEIASHISGTYRELMIDDLCHETKKERKKKRKKEAAAVGAKSIVNSDAKREAANYKSVLNVIPGGTTLPSRRSSSIDPPRSKESQDSTSKRPESAPETTVAWFDDQVESRERTVSSAPENKAFGMESDQNIDSNHHGELSESSSSSVTADRSIEGSTTVEKRIETSKNGSFRTSGILKSAKLSSPSFMKTALGTRGKRKSSSNNEKLDWSHDSEYSNDKSISSSPTDLQISSSRIIDSANGSAANGLIEESDESRSSCTTPISGKKEKKSTGLRKMVRKFF